MKRACVISHDSWPTWIDLELTKLLIFTNLWCLNWTPGAFGRLPRRRFKMLKQNLLHGRVPEDMEA